MGQRNVGQGNYSKIFTAKSAEIAEFCLIKTGASIFTDSTHDRRDAGATTRAEEFQIGDLKFHMRARVPKRCEFKIRGSAEFV